MHPSAKPSPEHTLPYSRSSPQLAEADAPGQSEIQIDISNRFHPHEKNNNKNKELPAQRCRSCERERLGWA